MTQILTTERLRACAESFGLDFIIENRSGIWVKEWFNNGCTVATAEEVMLWSMLAKREAQPVVAGRALFTKISNRLADEDGNIFYCVASGEMDLLESLIAAPPAPAVVNGRTADGWMAEALLQKKIADDLRNSAPAVPEAITAANAPEVFEIAAEVERLGLRGTYGAYAAGWNDFRAAMLAQPVSQGYKLPPHAYRELVNSLRDTAVKYSGTDQLRERLNTTLSQFIEPDHPHTRTAAPDRN